MCVSSINQNGHYQKPWGTTWFKSAFPHSCRLQFLPICKDAGLTTNIIYSFSTLESIWKLYLTPVRPKLEYASTVWNSIKSTDAKQLEGIQQKFVAQSQNHFFTLDHIRIFLHFWSIISCTTEDFILMQCFLFPFIQV